MTSRRGRRLRKRDAAAEAIEDIVPTTADSFSAKASIAVFLLEEDGEDELMASDHPNGSLDAPQHGAEGVNGRGLHNTADVLRPRLGIKVRPRMLRRILLALASV